MRSNDLIASTQRAFCIGIILVQMPAFACNVSSANSYCSRQGSFVEHSFHQLRDRMAHMNLLSIGRSCDKRENDLCDENEDGCSVDGLFELRLLIWRRLSVQSESFMAHSNYASDHTDNALLGKSMHARS